MRRIITGFVLLLASLGEVCAQAIVLPCVPSGNSCIPVSAANPLPTTGGGGTPGGANTNVQFNSSGSFNGDSGLTYAGSGGQLSLNGAALGATTGFLLNPASLSGNFFAIQLAGVNVLSFDKLSGTTNGRFVFGSGTTPVFEQDGTGFRMRLGAANKPIDFVQSGGISQIQTDSIAFDNANGDVGMGRAGVGIAKVTNGGSGDGALQLGATALVLAANEFGAQKITASGSAPGASGAKVAWVCGTNSGTTKLIAYGGTSSTPVTIVDNVGSGVTGC